MKKYTTLADIQDLRSCIDKGLMFKKEPFQKPFFGKGSTLLLLFFNASLRTRLSTEKAARNLGMYVSILNISNTWKLEFDDGTVMNMDTAEHIKEAAQVLSLYADIIAVRAFPSLTDKEKDTSEYVLNSFIQYATVPIVNLESATAHPLQALADAMTIAEHATTPKPKVVLSWAPHPKALPHAVPNSFIQVMQRMPVALCITHPKGYALDPKITGDTPIFYNQEEALEDADFIYVKNWCAYQDYGKVLHQDSNWMMTLDKLGKAKFMHCLPVRRNVVVEDTILDSDASLVIQQANNRTYAAQAVLSELLIHKSKTVAL